MKSTAKNDAPNGSVYARDTGLIHIADGERREMGAWLASQLNSRMRNECVLDGQRTTEEASEQSLCPGCYMVAVFNCALELAKENGQDIREMARSMAWAFKKLAKNPTPEGIEGIELVLDQEYDRNPQMSAQEWENYALAQLLTAGGFAWPT
jgi:hypothetical protein